MGWAALAVVGAAAFGLLRLLGAPRALGSVIAAALLLGATGYALQGRAGMAGHPVAAGARAIEVDPGMVAFRAAILPADDDAARSLAEADGYLRAGATATAVRVLLRATERRPRDPALWTGLGSALAAHHDGQVSPAALFAFRHAWRLAPHAPGPPFFLGLAYVQAGDLVAAKTAWLRALALTPRDAPYRLDVAERLVLIDEFQAMAAASPTRR